jgi:plastocyanin
VARNVAIGVCLALWAGGAAWAAAPPAATGTIEGVVRFTGKLPPPKKLQTMDGSILHHDLVVEKKTKGLRDVAVSLLGIGAAPRVTKREPAYVDQKELLFVPRVVAVQLGQAVRFDNSDTCNHSVQANSSVKSNQFNVFVTPGQPLDHVFEAQKHPVAITCSLHGWMKAYVYVFDHPFFDVTGEKGTFRIANVRPGKHILWLRHADTGLNEKREVEVRASRTTRVEVEWKKAPEP